MHPYKIIVAPGVVLYTRAESVQAIAAKVAKGESIRTVKPEAARDPASEARGVETLIAQFLTISREH